MKLKELEELASMPDSKIWLCKVISHDQNGITFHVDDVLMKTKEHLEPTEAAHILREYIQKEQIDNELADVVKCSFENETLSFLGQDTLYKCIIRCFAEHRPLVLTPDVIWLVICQTLSNYINDNAELFRKQIVDHADKLVIDVETPYSIDDSRCNWSEILDTFYAKIDKNTKNGIAAKLVADFTTTGINERVSSVTTLMHGVESYFTYHVSHLICGIPYITLKGTVDDWERLLTKASVLNEFGLNHWYTWVEPILKEFVRAAKGKPQKDFWENIVQSGRSKFPERGGCIPNFHYINGWCVALFDHREYDTDKPAYERCYKDSSMKSEMTRVGFKYREVAPDFVTVTPMELWSGIIGVEEDEQTFALTPKIGWFVRKSHEHEESLNRLKGANQRRGINLVIDEVPEILNELDDFSTLTLWFKDEIKLPDWLFNKSIQQLVLIGKTSDEYSRFIKEHFENVRVCKDEDEYYS